MEKMIHKNRIEYIDALKFIAIFSVIAVHGFQLGKGIEVMHIDLSILKQIFLFAVPIFLMITGSLFLNKDLELKDFFKRRFVRVVYPLIFFAAILYVTQLSKGFLYFYWYSWMIIGTLFAIPIINKFVQYSKPGDIEYYIIIFIIFSIINQIFNIYDIKYALDISFFYTPVSYLIIGYYLFNKKIQNPNRLIIISLILFIVSTLIELKMGQYVYSNEFHTYVDLSFFQIIQASAVFVFFKSIYLKRDFIITKILENKIISSCITSISKSSYGMYLVQHPLIFSIIKPKFLKLNLTGTEALILIIILILSVFVISWIITLILSRIPIINKFSGYA